MKLSGWGGYPKIDASICTIEKEEQLRNCLSENGSWIARGSGRSYGDSSLNEQVLLMRGYNRILAFDEEDGIISCQSGISLADLLEYIIPKGWFLPVTPGTKFITAGGAVASDIHGKNHHVDGCFSNFVQSFNLLVADGTILTCSRSENTELFKATCGGVGLTGIILDITLKLKPISGTCVSQLMLRAKNLDEVFAFFQSYKDWSYTVAWVDSTSSGIYKGRSVFLAGKHSSEGSLSYKIPSCLKIPFDLPCQTINRFTVRAFNAIWYYRTCIKKTKKLVSFDQFFYPLDFISNWNRIYGSDGFLQYQFVLPETAGYEGVNLVLDKIAERTHGSFLTVLKKTGPSNDNYLSFPIEGYTMSVDFKRTENIFSFLDELDRIILDYNGRVYLTKDARLKREVVETCYPQLNKFREVREYYKLNNKFQSLQSKRLGL